MVFERERERERERDFHIRMLIIRGHLSQFNSVILTYRVFLRNSELRKYCYYRTAICVVVLIVFIIQIYIALIK